MNKDEFEEIIQNRKFDLYRNKSRYKLIANDQVVLALNGGVKKVIAEYEVTEIEPIDKGTRVIMEPIYQAPSHQGVKLDELVLFQLKTPILMNKKVLKLRKADFKYLADKLTRL